MSSHSDLECQVWPHIVRLDCWSWVRIYGDTLWAGGHGKHHATRAQVYRSVTLAMGRFECNLCQALENDCVSASRKSHHHSKENPSQSVVSWSLDFGLLLLPCKRLFSARPGKHDGAPSYERITGTSARIFRLQSKYTVMQKFTRVVFPKFCFNFGFLAVDSFFVMWLQFCFFVFLRNSKSFSFFWSFFSALASLVCWRGYTSLLLFHRSWSSSQWPERSWSTNFLLLL